MFKFEKMIAWQKSVEYVDHAFSVADRFPQRYQFSLGEQFRRAALSITNNLAEGSGRLSPGSRRNFYDYAKGSVYETISILAIALRRNEIQQQEFDQFYRWGDELASIISGLIDATYREEASGPKAQSTLRENPADYEIENDFAINPDSNSNSNSNSHA